MRVQISLTAPIILYFYFFNKKSASDFKLFLYKNSFSLCVNFSSFWIVSFFISTIFCSFLSLGGLPPFLGFFPKWIIIQYLSTFNVPILCLIVICSLVILFFYLRICYSAFIIYNDFNIWKISLNKINKITLFRLFFMLFGLFIISFIFMVL